MLKQKTGQCTWKKKWHSEMGNPGTNGLLQKSGICHREKEMQRERATLRLGFLKCLAQTKTQALDLSPFLEEMKGM
jgi:hypothetical protein